MFDKPLRKERIGKRWWKVLEEFSWTSGKWKVIVGKGFITDLVSSPFFMWWLVRPDGKKASQPAVIHDFLYTTHRCLGRNREGVQPEWYWTYPTRKDADIMFRDALIFSGVPKWKANMMYGWVRSLGWMVWKAVPY